MRLLVRARELVGRPVVTLDGDDVAQIRDIIYAGSNGSVVGFTLAGRTLLSGPLREALPWKHVHSIGRHAVMIAGPDALSDSPDFDTGAASESDVLGDTVLTQRGTAMGQVCAAPGEAIVVADTATDVIANDLAGFGASVASWRASSHRRS